MSGPWEAYQQPAPAQEAGPWVNYAQPEPAPPQQQDKPFTASILPFRRNEKGYVEFDSNAGLLGAIKNALMLPSDAMKGRVDPLSDEAAGRAFEAAGVLSPVNPALRAGTGIVPGAALSMEKAKVAPPSVDALREAAGKGYAQAREMGVEYASPAVSEMAQVAKTALEKDGILGELAPKTHKLLNDLANPPPNSTVQYQGIEAARRAFGHAGKDFANPTEQLAARRAIEAIDGFIKGADGASVVAGRDNAASLSRTIDEARANYAAARRSQALGKAFSDAELRTAASHSGANGDNALRGKIASFLQSDRKSAGFTPAELDAAEKVVTGTPFQNALRTAGNIMGGGGGLGAAYSGGAAGAATTSLFGPAGGAAVGFGVPALGFGAKKAAESMTKKAFTSADEMVRKRSPLFEQMLIDAPMVAKRDKMKEAALRAYLLTGVMPQE